jgi:hypothetical protein
MQKAERSMYTFLDNRDDANAERRNAENHYTTNIESKAVANCCTGCGIQRTPSKDTLPGTTPTKELFDEEPGDKADLKHGTGMKSHRTMMMKTYRKGSKRMLIAP